VFIVFALFNIIINNIIFPSKESHKNDDPCLLDKAPGASLAAIDDLG
jgi:hypothetical protein